VADRGVDVCSRDDICSRVGLTTVCPAPCREQTLTSAAEAYKRHGARRRWRLTRTATSIPPASYTARRRLPCPALLRAPWRRSAAAAAAASHHPAVRRRFSTTIRTHSTVPHAALIPQPPAPLASIIGEWDAVRVCCGGEGRHAPLHHYTTALLATATYPRRQQSSASWTAPDVG